MGIQNKINVEANQTLAELTQSVSFESAHQTPKMFVVKQKLGKETLHLLLCFILKNFQDGLKITNPANAMSASEIFIAAEMLMGCGEGEYGYESVQDVLMALKLYDRNPFDLYNKFSKKDLRQILSNYLSEKADFLEQVNSEARREAMQKPPLSIENVRQEYERSISGQKTIGKHIKAEREQTERNRPENWRRDQGYSAFLAERALSVYCDTLSKSDSFPVDSPSSEDYGLSGET